MLTRKQSKILLGNQGQYETNERQSNPLLDHGIADAQHSSQIQDYCDNTGKVTKQRRGEFTGTRN